MIPSSTSIFLCGDPHGVFGHIVASVLEHRPAAIILLGDMKCARPLDVELRDIIGKTQICYIPGNHDTEHAASYDNLVTSPCENLHGRVLDVAGVRIGGLGGVFRRKVWNPDAEPEWSAQRSPEAFLRTLGRGNRWRDGLPLRHRSTIFPSELDLLARQRADVLVTHEAPGAHPNGFEALTRLAAGMGVTRAFHGHHHADLAYADGVWTGVGLRGITALDGTVIVAGVAQPPPRDGQA
ncbi:MAG: metallophosphoesterase [Pseudomonadota bacterium]|nr:metallophosphoesterase [Pseudomonadota bacterium]